MIPYPELCAALEAYAARVRGVAPPVAEEPTHHGYEIAADLPSLDDPLAQAGSAISPEIHPQQGGDEESTHVGQMAPVYEDRSNELDIGDVLADDETNN